jgi:5-methyltetrahydrofolate--homocysteine methyltransferase
LHRKLRDEWGFPDPPEMTMQERFTSRYRGKRYSFGYPACPNLEDQVGLFSLLKPEEIGVHLTEGFMMDPEASVSALVFHHPDCAYFTAAEAESGLPLQAQSFVENSIDSGKLQVHLDNITPVAVAPKVAF